MNDNHLHEEINLIIDLKGEGIYNQGDSLGARPEYGYNGRPAKMKANIRTEK